MNGERPWVVRVAPERIELTAELRLLSEVAAAFDGATLWLRGAALDQKHAARLSALADGPILLASDDDWLIPVGRQVATERLPSLTWKPLRDVLRVHLPVARIPAFRCRKVELTLVGSDVEQPATVLVTDWRLFRDWA